MRIRALPGVVGALVAIPAVGIGCGESPFSKRLGPVDGHDLPAIEFDRVAVGAEAPDFSLRALTGEVITLSDLRGDRNVVLVFYRGHW